MFRLASPPSASLQLINGAQKTKKIVPAFTTFRQLEIQSDGRPISESFFIHALRGLGFEDSESRLLLNEYPA
jgi:hypothetical protein